MQLIDLFLVDTMIFLLSWKEVLLWENNLLIEAIVLFVYLEYITHSFKSEHSYIIGSHPNGKVPILLHQAVGSIKWFIPEGVWGPCQYIWNILRVIHRYWVPHAYFYDQLKDLGGGSSHCSRGHFVQD